MRPNFFAAWPAASWASASLVTSSRVASSRSWEPRRAVTVLGSRAVATTASPAFSAASAIRAPICASIPGVYVEDDHAIAHVVELGEGAGQRVVVLEPGATLDAG